MEQHLSRKTNELFSISDKIVLYDLTNTYFEGQYSNSKLAKYGQSKEKRNDARLVVLATLLFLITCSVSFHPFSTAIDLSKAFRMTRRYSHSIPPPHYSSQPTHNTRKF